MAIVIGFRGVEYDDAEPRYCTTTGGWVLDRVQNQWLEAQSLADVMTMESYVPGVDEATAGVGGVEIGLPSDEWQTHNESHEFWSGAAGGRDWGVSGVTWPT